MRTFFVIFFCVFFATSGHATCTPSNIPASTPDSQLIDNGDGTVTNSKTGLMWKKCLEGLSGTNCAPGAASSFTWQQALQQPGIINDAGGFAGHTDWRLPNIKELRSIVEEQCYNPAINSDRFPNSLSFYVWSGSPRAGSSLLAWYVDFGDGSSSAGNFGRVDHHAVRLVRGGQ